MRKKILIIGLAFFLVMSSFSGFASKNIDTIKDKLTDTNSQINDLTKQKNQIVKETKDVKSELSALDQKLDNTAMDITELNDELARIELEKEQTQNELRICETKLAKQQAYFEERVKIMYKNSAISYLEVLFSSKDLFDFSSRLEMVKRIADYDKQLVEDIKVLRASIIEHQEALAKSQMLLDSTKKNLEVKKEELMVATREKQDRMKDLSSQEEEIKKQLEGLKKQSELFRQEILKLQSTGKYSGGALAWPLPGHTNITSPYGMRLHPTLKVRKMHTGIDLSAPSGTTIVAANSGTVISAGYNAAYGKYIIIDHGGGISTLYGHQSKLCVSKGDKVTRGQKIGEVGTTGYSTGNHLHFEVRRNGEHENPMKWYK